MSQQYKVLVDGKSAHGGDLVWSLPTAGGDGVWTPGDWHAVTPPIAICERGLHLTTEPMRWARVGMTVYAAEGAGESSDDGSDKTAYERARLLHPAPEALPNWWLAAERFITEEIPRVPWFQPDGDPDPAWRLFAAPTRDAARDAARAAAWDAAWAAAWDAARDAARAAALFVGVECVCAGLDLNERHREHARARWRVWQKGYALLGEADGVLYVSAPGGKS